jgi:dolichyl-diphosphooligosaccharide--protein glycosyltransferase
LAFYLRSTAISSKYVNSDDPYLAYRIADYFKDNLTLPKNDTLRCYPYGTNFLSPGGHLVWFYVSGIFAVLFKQFGFADPALMAMHFFPPFFGALMVLLNFFIAKEIFNNKKVSLIAALFLALLPAHIYRSNSAFADKEPIAGFFMLLGILFFIKSIKKFNWKFSLISGISLALMGMTWGGISIVMVMLALFSLLMIFLNQFPKNFVYTYLITSITTIGLIYFSKVGYIDSAALYANYLAIFLLLLRIFEGKYKIFEKITFLDFKKKFGTYTLLSSLLLIFLLALIYQPFGNKIFSYIQLIKEPLWGEVVATTVAENRPSDWPEFLSQLGVAYAFGLGIPQIRLLLIFSPFVFSIFGFVILLWNGYLKKIQIEFVFFLLAWFLLMIVVGKGAVRLLFLTSFPVALLGAYGLCTISEKIWPIKFSRYAIGKFFSLTLLGLSLGLTFLTGYAFGRAMQPSMSDNWQEALEWVKENSSPNDVILSWWDYGYIIQKIAERPTYVDPGQPAVENDKTLIDSQVRNQQVAKFFTSTNETQYLDWLKSLNVKYVILDVTMIGKYSAVSKIASWGEHVDSILIFDYTGSRKIENKTIHTFGPIWLIERENQIYPVFVQNNQIINISKICTTDKVITVDPNGLPGCVFPASNAAAFIGVRCKERCEAYDLTNTIFVSMWFRDAKDLKHFVLKHSNPEVKIFEVIY